ncbi:MAG: PAS domain S-box protein [Acidobacteriaceae bacterium]|nr:PAS domain S-box protein [Acidobacteriaceae bacterium]
MSTLHESEETRLAALEHYALDELPRDPAYDDIARLAAQITNSPVAIVTVLEQDRIRILGQHGTELDVMPRQSLPCEATIFSDGVYQIQDSRRDPLYSLGGIPLGDRRYRFYAGVPVLTPHQVAIGTLAVLDTTARRLTLQQIDALESLSHMATTRLELSVRARQRESATRAQMRVETALTVERNFVSAVLDTVGALVVVFDTAGRIVRFNRACEIISGYNSSELLGKYAWERLIPEEDVPGYIESFERIRNGEFPTAYENYWTAADGTRRHIAWSATALVDSHGDVNFIIGTGIDVTVQRTAETAIRESESRYRQIVEGSLGMVCTHDLSGMVLSINDFGAHLANRRVEDVIGHPLQEFIAPARQPLLEPYFRALLEHGEARGLLYLLQPDGSERVIAYRNRLVEPQNENRYVLGFGIDITEQIRAEDSLRSLIRQSNSVLESVGDGIYGIDLEGRCTIVNSAAAQMLGYRPEELLGRKMHDLIHHTRLDGTPYPEQECPIQATVVDMTSIRVAKEIFWRKDGSSFPVEYVARPQVEGDESSTRKTLQPAAGASTDSAVNLSTASGAEIVALPPVHPAGAPEAAAPRSQASIEGRAVGVVVAFTDISERNQLDRMKDEFISTVSHELRTPLTSLRAALGLLGGGVLNSKPEKMRQMMEIAIGNTDRLIRLVNDILDLERIGSGKAELRQTQCSVNELFERTTSLLTATAQKSNIRFTLEANDVQVWADPDRILQTLTNLVSNAIKFSPPASTIPSEIVLRAHRVTPEEALIEVQDHGRGIPEDKLQQIFERFRQVDASDSRTMGGTGLGLAICRSIVQQHGGHIWASSRLGEGSTFHFTLPTRPHGHLGA